MIFPPQSFFSRDGELFFLPGGVLFGFFPRGGYFPFPVWLGGWSPLDFGGPGDVLKREWGCFSPERLREGVPVPAGLLPPCRISAVTVGPAQGGVGSASLWRQEEPRSFPSLSLRFFSPPWAGGLCLLGAYADSDDEEGETPEKSARSADANGSNSADIDSTLANFLAVSAAEGREGGGEFLLGRERVAGRERFHGLRHCPPPMSALTPLLPPLGFEVDVGMSFSQEIDAITAPPQPAEPSAASSSAPPPTPPRPEPKESGSGQSSGTANGAGSAPAPEWQYDTQCSLAGGERLADPGCRGCACMGPAVTHQRVVTGG